MKARVFIDGKEWLDPRPQEQPTDVVKLIALFDALRDLPRVSTTLWKEEYPEAEYALTLWCSANDIEMERHDYALDAIRSDFSLIATVRLDKVPTL